MSKKVNKGELHEIGGHQYMGRNPQYEWVAAPDGYGGTWLKVAKGIPFVRTSKKVHSKKRLKLGKF